MPVGPPLHGFRAGVVRLVDYRREEFVDRHPSSRKTAGRRPFLLLLSPDTLQLSTASDATDEGSGEFFDKGSLLHMASMRQQRPPRTPGKPLALLHKLAHGGSPSGKGAAAPAEGGGGEARGGSMDGASRLLLDGEPLEEGQLLTFSIALSQISGVECEGRRIKVTFVRQRPHRSTESKDDWKAAAKALGLPFAMPFEAWKHNNWEVDAYLNRHRRDPFVSSVMFEADTPQEASALTQALEEAISRLGMAVSWLAKDLPLHDRPVVTLVTVAADGQAGGGAPACASEERIVCAFPRLKQALEVPIAASPPSPSALPAIQEEGEEELGAHGAAEEPPELAVHVWLHSPLGPAVATISEQQLRKSADAGGAPICVVAAPPAAAEGGEADGQAPAGALAAGGTKLEVVLQFSASRPLAPSPTRKLSAARRNSAAAAAAASAAGATSRSSSGSSSSGTSSLVATVSLLAIPLLSAYLQLILSGGGTAAVGVLQSVAFLVSSLAAIVGIVLLQLSARGRPAGAQALEAAAAQAPAPAPHWRLTLLHADLVSESQRQAGAPAVQRVVSSSPISAVPSGALPPVDVTAVELPAPIRQLVQRHPAVLSDDIAARFLVGLGHPEKAYQALRNMVEWVEAQGVADLVHQPQPRFEVIRQHYSQVFYCWSTRCDAVLEVEHTGRWREAYDALRALGVTEQELLRHQFFCMEYAFRVLDPRPLPQGKTVKIIDLEGLSMRDIGSSAFKWYLQVGGALLAVNYPQRLHKAFLLNAPTWSGVIWKVLAAVIPRRTREQLMLFTRKQQEAAAEALAEWVPRDQLPLQYGGTRAVPLQQSPLELEMAAYVRRLNEAAAAAGCGEGSGPASPPSQAGAQ